jgi:hypothetical protein
MALRSTFTKTYINLGKKLARLFEPFVHLYSVIEEGIKMMAENTDLLDYSPSNDEENDL